MRSPSRADEEVDLRVNEHMLPWSPPGSDSEDEVVVLRPGVSIVRRSSPTVMAGPPPHPVIARKMWPHGEVRFEDQWGRRLIPLGRRDSFKFDLWPVEEEGAGFDGGPVRGAWVRGGRWRGEIVGR